MNSDDVIYPMAEEVIDTLAPITASGLDIAIEVVLLLLFVNETSLPKYASQNSRAAFSGENLLSLME